MTNFITYSDKSSAVRGFSRATKNLGDAAQYVSQDFNGRWGFDKDQIPAIIAAEQARVDEELALLDSGVVPAVEEVEEVAPAPVAIVADNEDRRRTQSKIAKPVDFCNALFDNMAGSRRSVAIQAAVDAGVGPNTARAQYQKWFVARKVK